MGGNRRSGAHGKRRLWDEGGVRDTESGGENVLIVGRNVSAQGRIENRATYLPHE